MHPVFPMCITRCLPMLLKSIAEFLPAGYLLPPMPPIYHQQCPLQCKGKQWFQQSILFLSVIVFLSSGDCAFITSETGILTPWAAETKGRGNGPTPRGQGTYLRAVLCLLVPIKSLSAGGCYAFEEWKVHFSEGHLHRQEVAAGKTTTEE